jgi:hypothetical protein
LLGERETSANTRPFGAGKRKISQPDSAGVSQVWLLFNRTCRDLWSGFIGMVGRRGCGYRKPVAGSATRW